MVKNDIGFISVPDNICIEQYMMASGNSDLHEYLIMYPLELKGEKILEENKQKMLGIIEEYIKECRMYQKCIDMVNEFPFDSQKQNFINEAYDHQRKADIISEKMNEGISPYAWQYKDGFIRHIDDKRVRCDYVIYLEEIK